jgi:hypothetical protein
MFIRASIWAAGAAALLSAQAISAAPANTAPGVDPLVSLSLLSSGQASSALCSAGGACATSAAVGAALPSASLAVAGSASSAAMQDAGPNQVHPDYAGLALLFLFPVVLFIAMATEGNGNNGPVSPF